ncbi:MAG TPA: cytochrome C oxidase subunit IV family protein [Usitatibacter sp.]|nr:cytochrome C oxidase subunit IV family protein [Usitatibacter sp.]
MNSPPPVRVYILTWLALMALLAATFTLAHFRLGAANTAVGLAIAAAKVALVGLFFMHLRRASALIAIFAVATLFWLAILFGLSGTDYATRRIAPAPWSAPEGH